jgi:hypothetical protein
VYQSKEAVPDELAQLKDAARNDDFVASPPPPAAPPVASADAPAAAEAPARLERKVAAPERDGLAKQELEQPQAGTGALTARRSAESAERRAAEPSQRQAAEPSERREAQLRLQESAPAPADAAAAPFTEREKIERLIAFIAQLDDAQFIRNGKAYAAPDAAAHLRRKLEGAGDRVQTADDFIRLCASFSSQSGEAYLIRFADGRTRTAEDLLREQLATLENR